MNKQCFPIVLCACTHQYWPTNKSVHTIALYGHWMQSRGPTRCNKRLLGKSQGITYCQYDLMIMNIRIYLLEERKKEREKERERL